MQKTNLLSVITKLELGGAQKQLLGLIASLNKEKFKVFLLTADDGILLNEALSIDGLKIERSRFLERPINVFKDLLALIEIFWFIKRNKIEIVHTHSSKAGILGRWAARLAQVGIIVHTVHGWSFNDYQPGLLRTFYICLERFTAYFTDKIIVVSCYDKQKGLENRIGKQEKYVLIRYGVNYADFSIKVQNIKEEFGINASELVVGMISCFKPQKSPQDFIKLAFLVTKIIPNVKFILVGDGPLRKKTERLIYKFNLQKQIILTGWRRDISRILSTIDVFVLTSLWEGLPVSVLEAMVASLPVVATDTGGIEEVVIEGKTGFLVPPNNIEKMSEKLTTLLKYEDLRKAMGENAKDFLGFGFSMENMTENNQDLYENLIEKKRTGQIC